LRRCFRSWPLKPLGRKGLLLGLGSLQAQKCGIDAQKVRPLEFIDLARREAAHASGVDHPCMRLDGALPFVVQSLKICVGHGHILESRCRPINGVWF
jgi:hypothetical protein